MKVEGFFLWGGGFWEVRAKEYLLIWLLHFFEVLFKLLKEVQAFLFKTNTIFARMYLQATCQITAPERY